MGQRANGVAPAQGRVGSGLYLTKLPGRQIELAEVLDIDTGTGLGVPNDGMTNGEQFAFDGPCNTNPIQGIQIHHEHDNIMAWQGFGRPRRHGPRNRNPPRRHGARGQGMQAPDERLRIQRRGEGALPERALPRRMPMLQGNRLERERRRLPHHRWWVRRVLQHLEWPMLPPAHVVQRACTSAMKQAFQPSHPT